MALTARVRVVVAWSDAAVGDVGAVDYRDLGDHVLEVVPQAAENQHSETTGVTLHSAEGEKR
jgi:hypothetical protein